MADLQSCYFCASPEDLGEYAVVPPRLGGGDRSVVLCPDCKTKLLDVMEPLIERAEAGAAAGEGEADGSAATASEQGESESDGSGITMSQRSHGASSGTDDANGEQETTAEPASMPGADEGDDEPPQYGRAMRMLSNRPFPMDRSEVESMLANAYDLEREEIEAVLSHAESEGRLVAENGQLREP
jgi:hypothetical protein